MNNIKILHVSSNGNIGGREKVLHTLMSQGCDYPCLHLSLYLKNPSGIYYDEIVRQGVEAFSPPRSSFLNNLTYHVRLFDRFDLLVFHFFDLQLFLAAALCRSRKIYVLSGIYLQTTRTVAEVAMTFSKSIIMRAGRTIGKKDKSSSEEVPRTRRNLPNGRSLRRLYRKWSFIMFLKSSLFSTVIVNSKYAQKKAQDKLGIQSSKIRVIYNGVDPPPVTSTADLIRKDLDVCPNEFLIGTVCRYDFRKRIDRLLENFNRLSKDQAFRLLIVGGGDAQIEKQIKEYIDRHALASRVILTGTRMDIGNLINAMDLFVLPSDNESFGLALVESMLLRKPSIVYRDSGGPAEIIGDRSVGFVIETAEEFCDICKELRNNPSVGQKMGYDAAQYARESFSTKAFYTDINAIYLSHID